MSSPVVIEVIQECWTSIEPYIDLVSLISVSKSCNKLRQLVVDEDSGKIKASILKVPYSLDDDCSYGPISEHGPRLLNLDHFPSLKKLDIAFPWELFDSRDDQALENGFPLALPLLARKVENAYNLEVFNINAGSLIIHERGGRPQVAYETIKNNLIHCINQTKKLRHLSINSSGGTGSSQNYSSAFFAAMVPVIQAGNTCLEGVRLFCGGCPESSEHPHALHDFFEAVLCLQNLKRFHIISAVGLDRDYGPLINSITGACQTIEKSWGRIPSKSFKRISFMLVGCRHDQPGLHLQSVACQLLSLLSKVKALENLMLWLPLYCWNSSNISELIKLIEKSSLKSVGVNFEGYEDGSGKLISFLQNYSRFI